MDCPNCHTAGVVLTHIADEILRLKLMTRAGQCYNNASTRFHAQADIRYRQNEAAAIYGLALVDYLTNNRARAHRRLSKAVELLKEAERNWVSIYANYKRADFCRWVQSEISHFQDLLDRDLLPVLLDVTTLHPGLFIRVDDGKFVLESNLPLVIPSSKDKSES
jgi:hypothetical protein